MQRKVYLKRKLLDLFLSIKRLIFNLLNLKKRPFFLLYRKKKYFEKRLLHLYLKNKLYKKKLKLYAQLLKKKKEIFDSKLLIFKNQKPIPRRFIQHFHLFNHKINKQPLFFFTRSFKAKQYYNSLKKK